MSFIALLTSNVCVHPLPPVSFSLSLSLSHLRISLSSRLTFFNVIIHMAPVVDFMPLSLPFIYTRSYTIRRGVRYASRCPSRTCNPPFLSFFFVFSYVYKCYIAHPACSLLQSCTSSIFGELPPRVHTHTTSSR